MKSDKDPVQEAAKLIPDGFVAAIKNPVMHHCSGSLPGGGATPKGATAPVDQVAAVALDPWIRVVERSRLHATTRAALAAPQDDKFGRIEAADRKWSVQATGYASTDRQHVDIVIGLN